MKPVFVFGLLYGSRLARWKASSSPIRPRAASSRRYGLPATSGSTKSTALDGKLVFIQGGSVLLQAMLAGQAQASQNGVAETATAILRGGDVRMLGVTAKIFPYSLIARKECQKPPRIWSAAGVAINRIGDVSAYGSQLALRKLGLNPEKDVTMLQVGGSPQRLAALQSGSVQAAAMDFMSGLRLAKLGFPVLVQLNLNYPYLGPVVSGKFLRENPGSARRLLSKASSKASRASSATAKKASKRSPDI